MQPISIHVVESVIDEVKTRIDEIVPSSDLDCKAFVEGIHTELARAKTSLLHMCKTADGTLDDVQKEKAADMAATISDVVSEAAEGLKGEAQDEGGLHGSQLEDVADRLSDFVEEELEEILAPLTRP